MTIDSLGPFSITIIGGGGYIGFHIGARLQLRGHHVILFDISQPDSFWLDITGLTEVASDIVDSSWSEGEIRYKKKEDSSNKNGGSSGNVLKFMRGSLLDKDSLDKAISGADCVIHCASYGMSGKEQMPTQWSLTEQVNITGVENVLKTCLAHGVRGMVYTSSYNVVFGGKPIVNGDESLPYFPLHQHEDHYSRTKAIAERLVLFSDNLETPKSRSSPREPRPLRTCALRLAGVMGLGEKRHLPRIVDYFDFMFFKYGYGKNSLQQFATIGNVVQAHVKAAEHLLTHPNRLGGQAYFISDGTPINSFEFLQPLREALGYKQPTLVLPMWLMWAIVYLIRASHSFLASIHPWLSFPPMLTTAEVYKTAVTHYFSFAKAQNHFGYWPENPNDLSDVVEYFVQKQQKEQKKFPVKSFGITVICFILFALSIYLSL